MDLAALRNKSAQVSLVFDGETLRYTYNPHAYDDECQRMLHRLAEQEDNTALANMFEKLITSWDMKDSGTPVPCTYDTFILLPPFLRTKILNSLIEDEMERGKLRSSDNSSNQPTPIRRSALVPIGTQNSTTANGQDGQTGATS